MLQTVEPESFVTNPIIFGDYIKVGAAKEDRVYEDLSVLEKVKTSLSDVGTIYFSRRIEIFHRIG